MWKVQTSRQGKHLLNLVRRQLATESAPGVAPSSPIPPPPPPKTGGFGIFKFLGVTLPLASGSVLCYAWYDPEFRQHLEHNVPYVKEFLENVLPDTTKPVSASRSDKTRVIPALDQASKLNEDFARHVPAPPLEKPEETATSSSKSQSSDYLVEKEKKAQEVKVKQDHREVEAQLKKKEDNERADNTALEVMIHKLLTNSKSLADEAIKAQQDLATITRNHSKRLKHAMDDTTDVLQKDTQWEAVAVVFKERENSVVKANELVAESKKSIEKLRDVLVECKNNSVTKNNPVIFPATKWVADLTKDLSAANSQVRQAESEAKVMIKYKDLVDKGRKQFQKEIESLLPDVKMGSNSRRLTDEELNLLIAHAHRRIEQLQKQLAEQLALERQRIVVAMEVQKQEDMSLTEASLDDERQRLQNDFETGRRKLEMEFLVQQENEIRKQLTQQAAAHSDHLKDILAVQLKQLNREYERELNVQILDEREKFQTQVAGWISRLKGIETAIDERSTSEELDRSAQDLWLACIALNSTIHFCSIEDNNPLKPLKEEVMDILKVANKHPFVETVAATLSQTALHRGLHTEECLRERFVHVASVCRKLGLLTDANQSLYKYLVSFLHSFFVFDRVTAISEKDVVDLKTFDNYDLVAHAQYYMDHGNLEMALRFMNQLSGESLKAASDWIREAKLLLETRQAASTLTAYASATGLANTF